MNKILTIIVGIALLGVVGIAAYIFLGNHTPSNVDTGSQTSTTTQSNGNTQATSTTQVGSDTSVIGTSVEGRDITAYHFGTGSDEILFVGGIHGGYEWNTALVAFQLADYLKAHPESIPKNIKVTVIPVLNPDGLNKVVGTAGRFTVANVPSTEAQTVPGRFNANTVDLNRNFDCDWKATGTWQNTKVSGGSKPFSEPESQAIQSYVTVHKPTAAVVWYSAAGGVFSSNCHNGVSTETKALTSTYASASGYKPYETFNFYEITGDMVNWLAKNNIPAISVLLTNHTDTEWDKNLAGIQAVLQHYAK
jgi:hypothetical protein